MAEISKRETVKFAGLNTRVHNWFIVLINYVNDNWSHQNTFKKRDFVSLLSSDLYFFRFQLNSQMN